MSKANIFCRLPKWKISPSCSADVSELSEPARCFHDGLQPIGNYEPCECDTVALKPKQTAQQRYWRGFPLLHHFCSSWGSVWWSPKCFFLRSCSIYWLLYRSLDCEFTWQLGVFLERSSARHSSCRRNWRCSFLLLFCVILRSVYTLAFISILSLFLNNICWGALGNSFGQFVTADVMCFFFTLWVCVCVRQAGWVTWLMDCVGVQQPDDAYQSKLAYWETQSVVVLFHRTSEWGHCCWVGTQALRHVRCREITRGTILQALNNKAGIIVTKTRVRTFVQIVLRCTCTWWTMLAYVAT